MSPSHQLVTALEAQQVGKGLGQLGCWAPGPLSRGFAAAPAVGEVGGLVPLQSPGAPLRVLACHTCPPADLCPASVLGGAGPIPGKGSSLTLAFIHVPFVASGF